MKRNFKRHVAKRFQAIILTAALSVGILDCVGMGTFSVTEPTTVKAATNYGLQDDVQDGVILHCWNWSYNNIKENMATIAASGYSAVQTSPVTQPKDYAYEGVTESNVGIPDGCGGSEGQWWKLYQPVSQNICDNGQSWLGTKDEFEEMCAEAEKYGVKVIVDIVANHMANIKGWQNSLSDVSEQVGLYCNPDMLTNADYWHINTVQCWYSDGRYDITQGSIGMPDLNTADKRVQNMILNLLKECVDAGADGFRFDAAKHIETPDDDSAFASDFWPTVINGIRNYADHDLYIYGEILNTVGDDFDIGNYTKYMSVTDNGTGDHILSDVRYGNASSASAGSTRYEKTKTVLWAESHDTYMGGPSYLTTDKMVKQAWAVVAAKKDSTALYFARPYYSEQILLDDNGNKVPKSEVEPTLMGEVGTMTWSDPEVAAVNNFHNYFVGQDESVSSSGSVIYTERGNSGVVISNLSGAGYVEIPAYRMASGTYTDKVSGNTFTVSNGTIKGTIGSSDGIAVVYNGGTGGTVVTKNPTITVSQEGGNFYGDSLTVSISLKNATSGTYQINNGSAVSFGSSVSVTLGADVDYGTSITLKVTAKGDTTKTATYTFTKTKQDTSNLIYCKNTAGWSNVYCYMWNSSSDTNASWPGVKMTSLGDNVWSYAMTSSYKNVIFNNGSGTQTADLSAPGSGYIYDNNTGSWTTYGNSGGTEDPQPETYKVYCKNQAGWSNVCCYMWNSASDTIGAWPGVQMTYEGNNVWSLELSTEYANVIFTNGSGTQTADLSFPGEAYIYNNSTGSWETK